jgi:hypothetical protein
VSFSQFSPQLRTFNSLLRGSVLHDGTGQRRVTAVCVIPCRREPIAAAGGDRVFTHGGPTRTITSKPASNDSCTCARSRTCMLARILASMQVCERDRLGLSGRALRADTHAHQQVCPHAHKQTFKQTCEPTCQHASVKVTMHACLHAKMHATTHANLLANMKGST